MSADDSRPVAVAAGPQRLGDALLRSLRPKQWLKNVLVFAAPAAAGVLTEGDAIMRTVGAFVLYCGISSGTYLLNDVLDRDRDRRHPAKRHRPIAAGLVPVPVALGLGALMVAACLAIAPLIDTDLLWVLLGYLAMTVAYSVVLKHLPIIDMMTVAFGFVLRAVAGAAATDVPVSQWFLIVTMACAVFVVGGKRGAELRDVGERGDGGTRAVLQTYTHDFLSYVRTVSSGVALVTYCLWAFERAEISGIDLPLYQLSAVPFAAGMLRYAQLVEAGEGGAPEDLVFEDRVLWIIGAAWTITFGWATLFA